MACAPPLVRTCRWHGALLIMLAVLAPLCAQSRPNFVIIMADDLGYNDLGVTGNPDVETPHINGLAWESVRFDRAYANPICAPTRAQLLTGRHYLRTGVWGVHGTRDFLNADEKTFADRLKEGGYRTAMFGKWHNGNTDGYAPWDRGFEEACSVQLYDYRDNDAICNRKKRFAHGWTIQKVFDWAINYMDRKKHESFAMYLPLMTPHLGKTWHTEQEGWHAPQNLISKYENKGLSFHTARLYASIEFMDYNVGRLLQHLDHLGLSHNTVVIFLSDNGPTGNWLMPYHEWRRRNRDDLNGIKGEIRDNGIRVPLFIRWRGKFQSAQVHNALVSVEDLFPTMMDLAGVGWGDRHIDGKSLTPLLWNPHQVGHEWLWRTMYHVEGPPNWTVENGVYWLVPNRGQDKSALKFSNGMKFAVRNGRYKYSNIQGSERLFDMWNDPKEHHEIWDWNKIGEMRGWFEHWWNNMIWEHGTFSAPIFYLGWTANSEILPMGAAEVSSDLKVMEHHVEGWVNTGTYVYFKVTVLRQGCYNAHLVHWGGFQGDLGIEVSCNGDAYASGRPTWGGYFAKLCVPGSGWGCSLKLSVASGGGWMGFNKIILMNA